MIHVRNKQTCKDRVMTQSEYDAICARGEAWKNLYEIILVPEPPTPKEIKKTVREKQTPEFDNDGIKGTDAPISWENPGEEQ
jgi:hypothetical protein